MWRAAAAIVLVAGSAVVLQREAPVLPTATAPAEQPVAPPVAEAPATKQPEAPAPAATARRAQVPVATLEQKELVAKKLDAPTRDKDAAALADVNAANAVNAPKTADRSVVPAAAPAPAPTAAGASASGAVAQRMAFAAKAEAKSAVVICFEQRVPPADSANRVIRIDSAALADSVRLERLALRGDTLTGVRSRLIALRVSCP
jgi:hypothetical protein